MNKQEAWKLKNGDFIVLTDGRHGTFRHFGAKGIRKPYVKSARRAQATEFAYLDPLGYVPIGSMETVRSMPQGLRMPGEPRNREIKTEAVPVYEAREALKDAALDYALAYANDNNRPKETITIHMVVGVLERGAWIQESDIRVEGDEDKSK